MIDSHVHFWNYHPVKDAWISEEMQSIRRDFTPIELEEQLKQNGVEYCIAVQADQTEDETNFLLQYAEKHPFIRGIVGWIDLCAENLQDRLAYFSTFKKIKGWRHILQAEADDFFMAPKFLRGIAALKPYNYTYDLLVNSRQLTQTLRLVEQYPDQTFVLDHIAKPAIGSKKEDHQWKQDIKLLAQHPSTYCKVSGMVTEANWPAWNYANMSYYLETILEEFGAERLMFGSDWPVCTLAASYGQTKQIVDRFTAQLSDLQRQAIFETTAIKCYNL